MCVPPSCPCNAAVHRSAQALQSRLHYPASSQAPRLSLTAAHCYEPPRHGQMGIGLRQHQPGGDQTSVDLLTPRQWMSLTRLPCLAASPSLPKIQICWLIFIKFAKVMGSSEDKNLFLHFCPQRRLPRELHGAGTHQPAWESHELAESSSPTFPRTANDRFVPSSYFPVPVNTTINSKLQEADDCVVKGGKHLKII